MSLITRCPACGTMFNVVTDQLKVSQGWVRCGLCSDVFDASLNLQRDPKPEPPGRDYLNSDPNLVAPALSQNSPRAVDVDLLTAALVSERVIDQSGGNDFLHGVDSKPSGSPEVPHAADKSIDDPQINEQQINDTPAEVTFVREARRQAFWRKPLLRALFVLAAVLLLALLLVQFVFEQREYLAAYEPRLKPALQVLCKHVSCDIDPVRRIDAIVIDSSTFTKASDGAYLLGFSIKNTGVMAVEMPSIELTLTDNEDKAVIRRVLSPEQLGAMDRVLAANSEFSGALTLQVLTESPLLRVAGYRLLAFYP